MKSNFEDKIKSVVEYWDYLVPLKACEEAGELVQAISKYEGFTKQFDYKNKSNEEFVEDLALYEKNLIDEIGDMYITLEMVIRYFGIDAELINERVVGKLNKEYE